MISIASICPLVFNPIRYDKFGNNCYIQKFYTTDEILVQVISNEGAPSFFLNNLSYNSTNILLADESGATLLDENSDMLSDSISDSTTLSFETYGIDGEYYLYQIALSGLNDSIYSISINDSESEPFEVTSDRQILEDSILIKCSHYDNNSAFNNIWWANDVRQYVSLRVEGGFKPDGISEQVDNEYFRNQFQEITGLYSVPYQTRVLTVGNATGVPYWIANIINKMLCVSYLSIDGVFYVRSESSVPEKAAIQEGGEMFWYSITLELKDNEVVGVGGSSSDITVTSGEFAVSVSNLSDGDILRYSIDKGVWTNTNTVD